MWVLSPEIRGVHGTMPAFQVSVFHSGRGRSAMRERFECRSDVRTRKAPLLSCLPWESSSPVTNAKALVSVSRTLVAPARTQPTVTGCKHHRTRRKPSRLCSTIARKSSSSSNDAVSVGIATPTTTATDIRESLDEQIEGYDNVKPASTSEGLGVIGSDEGVFTGENQGTFTERRSAQKSMETARQMLESAASNHAGSTDKPRGKKIDQTRPTGEKWRFQKYEPASKRAAEDPAGSAQMVLGSDGDGVDNGVGTSPPLLSPTDLGNREDESQGSMNAVVTIDETLEGMRRQWRFPKYEGTRRKDGALEPGEVGPEQEGKKVWSPSSEAIARVCKQEPRLAKAFESFDEKCPGSTIIFLAYSGSRLYGTSTANSDLDIKGVYIPGPAVNPKKRRQHNSKGKKIPEPPRRGNFDADFPMEKSFWFSTSSADETNTEKDVDVELLTMDSFLVKLLRAQVGAIEILFSMMTPHAYLLEDPEIVPVIVRERPHLVTRYMGSWIGYMNVHLERFRKLYERGIAFDQGTLTSSNPDGNIGGDETTASAVDADGVRSAALGDSDAREEETDTGSNIAEVEIDREQLRLRTAKVLSHARRVMMQVDELLQTGSLSFPLSKQCVGELMHLRTQHTSQHSIAAAVRVKLQTLHSEARECTRLPVRLNRRRLVTLRDEILWLHHMHNQRRHEGREHAEEALAPPE